MDVIITPDTFGFQLKNISYFLKCREIRYLEIIWKENDLNIEKVSQTINNI